MIMKKYLLISLLLLLPAITFGEDRGRYLRIFYNQNTEQSVRTQTMESLVERYFFSTSSPLFRGAISFVWSDIRKEDFSETAKATLLCHLADRTLPDSMIEQIRNRAREFMQENWEWWQEYLQQRAEREDIDFDVLFEQILNERVSNSIKTVQEREIEVVPVIIPLLLGWLEYEPAIPVLNTILTDSIPNTNYALHHREIFTRNVRLALARMGDKEIEQEFLEAFSKADASISRRGYINLLQQMYYINSRTAIDAVIESLEREFFIVETSDRFPDEVFSSNDFTLLTLYHVILDYPLEFEFPSQQRNFDRQLSWEYFIFFDFYTEQFPFLKQWIQENRETLQINRERFIIIWD